MNPLIHQQSLCKHIAQPFLFIYVFAAWVGACATPATFKGMVPASFEIEKKHPQAVRVHVTGGQETEAVGRPQITDSTFSQALVAAIIQSQTFSGIVGEHIKAEDYLLTVTLFSTDKRVFGKTVKLEAGWILRRSDNGATIWQESIISEHTDSDVRLATEGAARNNIAQGLAKISKLSLYSPR